MRSETALSRRAEWRQQGLGAEIEVEGMNGGVAQRVTGVPIHHPDSELWIDDGIIAARRRLARGRGPNGDRWLQTGLAAPWYPADQGKSDDGPATEPHEVLILCSA